MMLFRFLRDSLRCLQTHKDKFRGNFGLLVQLSGPTMTGGNVLNRPKKALQKNLNKLTRVKKAQKKKQQQKGKGSKQSNNQRSGPSISAKKKRLIMKQVKRQQREENEMEVVTQQQSSKKSEGKTTKSKAEKMDTS